MRPRPPGSRGGPRLRLRELENNSGKIREAAPDDAYAATSLCTRDPPLTAAFCAAARSPARISGITPQPLSRAAARKRLTHADGLRRVADAASRLPPGKSDFSALFRWIFLGAPLLGASAAALWPAGPSLFGLRFFAGRFCRGPRPGKARNGILCANRSELPR